MDIDESLNQTLPYLGFIKKISKPGALFELELVTDRGYYYRTAFTSTQNEKQQIVSKVPDTHDVYCEIRVIAAKVKP